MEPQNVMENLFEPTVPPKPPYGVDGGYMNVSFRKKCGDRNLLQENAMKLEFENENRLLPKFTIEPLIHENLCHPWKKCLVSKLLGKSLGFMIMREKLKAIWKLKGGFDLMDLEIDKEKVINVIISLFVLGVQSLWR
ncbi:hypothetical protein HKD37_13G035795 [Glycine soja]